MTPNAMLSQKEVAARLGVHVATLAYWRRHGHGPAFHRLGWRTLRYDPMDVERWIRACTEVPAWQA